MRPGYAVMFNIGAGMIVLTREAAEALLATYRSTAAGRKSRMQENGTRRDQPDL